VDNNQGAFFGSFWDNALTLIGWAFMIGMAAFTLLTPPLLVIVFFWMIAPPLGLMLSAGFVIFLAYAWQTWIK
jgi:hypothetical protein